MASSLPESWGYNNVDVNDTNMSNALIMSLWEETQADLEHDEERLSSLIRALEVELDPTTSTTEGHREMSMDTYSTHQFGSSNNGDIVQLQSDAGYGNGGDCSASGFGWVSMEMGSSSQGDEHYDNSWYLNSCDFDEIDCMSSNFEGDQQTALFEEHGQQNVWQEACSARMLV